MKRITLFFLLLAALTLSAISADETPKPAPSATVPPADNTSLNERDRSGATKTTGDQSESPSEIKITAAIRRAVMADKSLGLTAKNVKIITTKGLVTLRGPVQNAAEKATITKLARANAGTAKIDNQLEVAAAP